MPNELYVTENTEELLPLSRAEIDIIQPRMLVMLSREDLLSEFLCEEELAILKDPNTGEDQQEKVIAKAVVGLEKNCGRIHPNLFSFLEKNKILHSILTALMEDSPCALPLWRLPHISENAGVICVGDLNASNAKLLSLLSSVSEDKVSKNIQDIPHSDIIRILIAHEIFHTKKDEGKNRRLVNERSDLKDLEKWYEEVCADSAGLEFASAEGRKAFMAARAMGVIHGSAVSHMTVLALEVLSAEGIDHARDPKKFMSLYEASEKFTQELRSGMFDDTFKTLGRSSDSLNDILRLVNRTAEITPEEALKRLEMLEQNGSEITNNPYFDLCAHQYRQACLQLCGIVCTTFSPRGDNNNRPHADIV